MVNPIGPSMEDPGHKINKPSEGKISPQSEPDETDKKYSDLDPHGIWAKFLSSQTGGQATKEEVESFIHSYSQILTLLVKQNQAAFEREKLRWKDAQEGR